MSTTTWLPYSLTPSGNALKNDPNFPNKRLFSSEALILGERVRSTDLKSRSFKSKGHGHEAVFNFRETRFCSRIDTLQYSIFLFPRSAISMSSLIMGCGTGIEASTVRPFKSEKLLSIIFWKISSIATNSSRFYLQMQFPRAHRLPSPLRSVPAGGLERGWG